MNFRKFKTVGLLFGAIALLSMNSCKKDDDNDNADTDLKNPFPTTMTVDIPDAIAGSSTKSTLKAGSERDGAEFYNGLRMHVAVAKAGAQLLDEFMDAIREYQLNRELDITFTDDTDNREKHLVVVKDQTFEGISYKFKLTLSDVLNSSNEDEGIGLQIFWSGNPVKGLAIIKAKNLNENENDLNDALIRIDYSEEGLGGYDATMVVSIADLATNTANIWSMDRLKLFAGKKGDIIDMFGNSNHPLGTIIPSTDPDSIGINYAFVASGNLPGDYAVAEVGLPLSSLNTTSRDILLKENSIKNVLIKTVAINESISIDSATTVIEEFDLFRNITPPGFFANNSFVEAGIAPDSAQYASYIIRMDALTPYNPSEVADLSLDFSY